MKKIKHALLLFAAVVLWSNAAMAQTLSVKGTVTDDLGESMPGVTVLSVGTTTGTTTDVNGNYTLAVKPGTKISFSFLGYKTVTLPAQPVLNVKLDEDSKKLEDVVVIGYGTLEKRQVTGSITSIAAKDLPVGMAGATIMEAMKGKVSGLVMGGNLSDSPNSDKDGVTLQLRGMASINASSGPLVVIDGMPGGDLRSVAQDDIKSIDILKDASAGAIYGTRATGGVILITTKEAQEGKLKVSYTGEAIVKQAYNKPRMLTGDEFAYYKDGEKDYDERVDWWDLLLAPNPTSQRHTVTLQGGNKDARIYASAMYENNRGVMIGDERTDYAGRINGNFKALDGWLNINTHIEYRQTNRNLSTTNMGTYMVANPTRSPYVLPDFGSNPTGNDKMSMELFERTGYYVWFGDMSGDHNSLADVTLVSDKVVDTWFRPDVELKLNILPIEGLSYNQTFAYENKQREHNYYRPSYTREEMQNKRDGTAELGFEKTIATNMDGYLSFVRNIGEHSINAQAGYSYYELNRELFSMKNYDFPVDGAALWDIGSGSHITDSASLPQAEMKSKKDITVKLMAFFGRINYAYQDKYMAAVSFRREASTRFAKDNRWGDFYSISAGWRLSGEGFLQDVSWINDLKLRAGYGVTGNEGFKANYSGITYTRDGYYLTPAGQWAYPYGTTQSVNSQLGWEEKHEWNIGLDYSLFDTRLYGKVDVYRRDIEKLIYYVDVPQPPNVGAKQYKNIGTLSNIGWEAEIGGDIIRSKDWNYSTMANFSANTTKVGSLDGDASYIDGDYSVTPQTGAVHRLEEGETVNRFRIYKYAGIDDKGDFLIYNDKGEPVRGKTNAKDENYYYLGNYMPAMMIGWSHNLSYKNLSLGVTLTSWIDYDVLNTVDMMHGLPKSGGNVLKKAFDKNADIKGEFVTCDYFMEDATFFKIQNINLTYTLNTKKYLKVLDSVKLYLTVNNVATFTGYGGINPEVDVTGWQGGVEKGDNIYPNVRTYTLGLQLNF